MAIAFPSFTPTRAKYAPLGTITESAITRVSQPANRVKIMKEFVANLSSRDSNVRLEAARLTGENMTAYAGFGVSWMTTSNVNYLAMEAFNAAVRASLAQQ